MRTPETKNYVTKAEAARRLRVNRPLLDKFLARPGAPSPTAAKRYDLAALAAFITSQGENQLDTLRGARLTEVQLRCEKLRRELDRDAGLTVSRADVNELFGRMAAGLRSLLYTKLENEMPPKLAGCDALALRKYGRTIADEVVGRLNGEVETWNS